MATPRRNGQLSSCEPCRTSKLRCDHTSPVCGRCERRDLPCTYHPAPLTQVIAGIRPKKKIRVARDSTGPGIIHGLRNDNSAWTRKKASASAPGFLGQTSYSDVFTDISSGLPAGTIHTVGHDAVPVDSKQINLGAQVLVLLENLTFYREVVTTRFKKYKGWTLGWPMTNLIFTVVEEMWDSLKQEEMDTSARALLMSRRLFETFTKDFEVHLSTTWEEFKIASSGRWETVGLLFIITGLATDLVPHDDPIFNTMDAKSIAITASAVGDICIQFCDNTGIVNDLVSWLLLHQTSLLAVVYGESGMSSLSLSKNAA
jgi:chromatin structure-remodeling complex subunit RSC3/30